VNLASWLAYRAAESAALALPRRGGDALACWIAAAAFRLPLRARRTLEQNLQRALPGLDRAALRRHARAAFRHFALSFVDFLRLARLSDAEILAAVEVRGLRHLERAAARGRGVIVLSAHLGNWEWGAALLSRLGVRVTLVAQAHASARVEALFASRRGARGVATLHGRATWSAARALRRNECVAVMGDRRPQGRDGSACAWAAALARRTGATLVPALMTRAAPGRYTACFERGISPEACVAGGFRDVLRRHVARDPGQWLAFEPLPEGIA
jgi:KDO2-lipid IV(A) lauroyltransferase